MSKYIKEILFGVLFLIVVVLIIGIIFYEFIPNQLIPEARKYEQSADTTKLLSQIVEEQQDEQKDNKEEVLKSYELTSEDLSTYNKVQYEKGKNHPFFDYTSVLTNEENATSTNTTSTSGTTTSSLSTTSVENTEDTTSTIKQEISKETSSNSNSTSTKKVDTSSLRDTSDSTRTTK